MPKQTRRFGAFHRSNKTTQPPLARMFPPSDEKSGVSGEKSGVNDKSVVRDDKSGVNEGKELSQLEKFSTEDCGKVCGKTRFGCYKFLTILDF